MKKLLAGATIALICGVIGAYAVGIKPGPGPRLIDGDYVNGIANGQNNSFVSGVTAAGTTQATATVLPAATALYEVDTTAASTGVSLPFALPGVVFELYNNGASTLTVYPAVSNNPVTGAQDTINNGTSLSGGVATHVAIHCFSAKAGVWACQ